MEILVKQGRWLVNGKSTEELTKKEFDSLNNHLALIREDYYSHHENGKRNLKVESEKRFVYVMMVVWLIAFMFTSIAGFVKFIVNQKQQHQITNQWK